MSGKLIMKRKLDKTQQHQSSSLNNKVAAEESSTSTSPSSLAAPTLNKHTNQANRNEESRRIEQPQNKRIRCDTPPPEPEDLDLPPLPQVTEQNRHLLEAIQLKMLELQNELDAFEHDVDAHEDDYYYHNELNEEPQHHQRQNNEMSEQEAEALGFAMCAQETMLFLQREGVSSDSILYTRLRDALVGRAQPDRV